MTSIIHCENRLISLMTGSEREDIKLPILNKGGGLKLDSKLGKILMTVHEIGKTRFIRVKVDGKDIPCMGIFGDVNKIFPIKKD